MNVIFLLLIPPVAITAWLLLRHRLVVATEDLRLEVAERSGKVLANPKLDESTRRGVENAYRLSFSPVAMRHIALVYPFYIVWHGVIQKDLPKDETSHITDEAIRKEITLVRSLAMVSAMTLSPFFAGIVLIEVGLLLFPLFFASLPFGRVLVVSERLA